MRRLASAPQSSLAVIEEGDDSSSEDEDHLEDNEEDDDKATSDPLGEPPHLASSHTICVVDNSASMRRRDVAGDLGAKLRRCDALTGTLKRRLFDPQRSTGAGQTDLVSCVTMQDSGAHELCALMPFPKAYDTLLGVAGQMLRAQPRGEGFYLKALAVVEALARQGKELIMPNACTTVLFLSDGRPSDPIEAGGCGDRGVWLRESFIPSAAASMRCVWKLLGSDHRRLKWWCLGFGDDEREFDILKQMGTVLPSQAASFLRSTLQTSSLEQSLTRVSSTLTHTRLATSSTKHRRGLRSVLHKQFETRFTRYQGKIFASPPAGQFNQPNELLGEIEIEVADGSFECGGERNVTQLEGLGMALFEPWLTLCSHAALRYSQCASPSRRVSS